MFNKYRGQPQIKNINRSSEKDAFIRKPQAKPAGEDVIDDPSIRSAIDSVTEPVKQLDADYEASRQQEEDEWFRRFKGEPEPKEEPATEQVVPDEEAELSERTVQASERIEITEEPAQEEVKEESSKGMESSENVQSELSEIDDGETAEEAASEELAEAVGEMTEDEVPQEEEPVEKLQTESVPVTEEEPENREAMEIPDVREPVEEAQNVTAEEDDEKWIQDLLSDIQEKTSPAVDEDSIEDENSQPLVIAVSESKEPLEEVDESDWYQSTPLIRTAALIVLDLTEPVDEEYVEETPEDEEFYQSNIEETEEAELVPEPEEFSEPIDEEYVEDSEDDSEEITIDDVDEKLASLMEDEPKTDLDMDEMLDNMDRIIQQTEPTPVKFMEETAPAPQPRVNPNRNRKKKKKKKR